jgi:hypothetical protein
MYNDKSRLILAREGKYVEPAGGWFVEGRKYFVKSSLEPPMSLGSATRTSTTKSGATTPRSAAGM